MVSCRRQTVPAWGWVANYFCRTFCWYRWWEKNGRKAGETEDWPWGCPYFINHINRINIKFQLLRCNICLYDCLQVMHDFRKGCFLFLNLYLAAFNAAHIQDIINQTQQMIAGRWRGKRRGFEGILGYGAGLYRWENVWCAVSPYNCIHRCPDIMGHIIKKGSLRLIGMLCCLKGILKVNLLFLQPFFHFFLIIYN